MSIPDPLDDFQNRDYEYAKWLKSLPKCDSCGEPIQDNPYHIIEFANMDFNLCNRCWDESEHWRDE